MSMSMKILEEFKNLLRPLADDERSHLERSLMEDGCRDPLVVWASPDLGPVLLDGHNRHEICTRLGIGFETFEIDLPDPDAAKDWIDANQLAKRNLTPEEFRLALGRRYNRTKQNKGGDRKSKDQSDPLTETTAARLAKEHGVSEPTVKRAGAFASEVEAVEKGAAPELVDAMHSGRVKPSVAVDIAKAPIEEQAEIVARGEREILEAAKKLRAEKAVKRREERLEKIEEISKGNLDLDTSRKYPVIYADPPWRYEMPAMGGTNRSIENHYPTMTLEEICAMPVAELAADDAMLYLWATAPKLPECLEVVKAWGAA